jgi:hypothetical protein
MPASRVCGEALAMRLDLKSKIGVGDKAANAQGTAEQFQNNQEQARYKTSQRLSLP